MSRIVALLTKTTIRWKDAELAVGDRGVVLEAKSPCILLGMIAFLALSTIVILHTVQAILHITSIVWLSEISHTKPTNIHITFHTTYTTNIQITVSSKKNFRKFFTVHDVLWVRSWTLSDFHTFIIVYLISNFTLATLPTKKASYTEFDVTSICYQDAFIILELVIKHAGSACCRTIRTIRTFFTVFHLTHELTLPIFEWETFKANCAIVFTKTLHTIFNIASYVDIITTIIINIHHIPTLTHPTHVVVGWNLTKKGKRQIGLAIVINRIIRFLEIKTKLTNLTNIILSAKATVLCWTVSLATNACSILIDVETFIALIAIVSWKASWTIIHFTFNLFAEGYICLLVDGEDIVVVTSTTEIIVRASLTILNIAWVSSLTGDQSQAAQQQNKNHFIHNVNKYNKIHINTIFKGYSYIQ